MVYNQDFKVGMFFVSTVSALVWLGRGHLSIDFVRPSTGMLPIGV
jgi:hypothetical protein